MTSILIVDDDINILNLVDIYLTRAGYRVFKASDGMEALESIEGIHINLAVVDVMMPEMDGFQLTQQLREDFDIPVILLTAKGEMDDKEKGFRSGSDDYVVKPFEPKELLFRIQAVLRRYDKQSDMVNKVGEVTINRKSYEVQVGNQILLMPLKEFELLSLLISRPNQVFTRNYLIENIWGLDFEGDDRTVDVHIKRIRERLTKLTDVIAIVTVRGVGYRLEVRQP
ncbi:DNA-binding response regulator, OmpR family, contains REC and winged-helix (wHTH) domain [Virgibacillus subterraneus]|uniref:Heme response regulator HssR n=1 Tax=Virgibacillus subterraneus TaxID=621109 RepID=A0A1H9GGN2_9BACI|nr:response regulator transcription factor [Virgibacillus subterraneus]SEQ49270.1 DNA-binding response regulator, OmpR family, contains REC and winged-helix (wHTH) domain [Virgibacillus subterraneus]